LVVLHVNEITDGNWRERVRVLVEMGSTERAGAQGLLFKLYGRFLTLGMGMRGGG
jgi:hypothetical protein